MKALGILASPRKGQVSDNLTDAALNGLKDRGAEVEKVHLYDLDIKPCKGCMSCWEGKKCAIDDDYTIILDKMDKADVVVFASPVYYCNVTSVAKVFVDRSTPFFTMTKLGPKRLADKPSRVILIANCGAPFPLSHILGVIPGCMRPMKLFFKLMRVKIEILAATGVSSFDPVKCKKFLKKAYKLGKNI